MLYEVITAFLGIFSKVRERKLSGRVYSSEIAPFLGVRTTRRSASGSRANPISAPEDFILREVCLSASGVGSGGLGKVPSGTQCKRIGLHPSFFRSSGTK